MLEPGSLICLKSRAVVGVVADLIGRVEEPRYTVRFTNDDDIRDAGLWGIWHDRLLCSRSFNVCVHSTTEGCEGQRCL